ncbi:MAG TPA: hypothetical protein VM425_12055 [Myxococcota bacterium]|nr:hypothetical protein [Myxococcota bacterium]
MHEKKMKTGVMGISPAFSEREHIEIYGSPIEHYDMILFSGLGLMERDIGQKKDAEEESR